MNEFDLRGMQAGDVARAVRSGELRATAIAEAQWAAIERDEPAHGAYIVQFRDESLRAAERLDTRVAAGESLGPLAGVPMALKDIYDMNGVATTAGMGIHRDSIAERDATVVTRLKQADAVILGKVTLTEGVYAEHREAYPAPINPWRADHWAGASSTGTGVAMAAGAAYLAQQPNCLKHTLDISGDGTSNLGPRPRDVKQQLAGKDVTVNALVIEPAGNDAPLTAYFAAEVVTGPAGFALPAAGFDAYQSAMTTKLLRELAVLSLAQLAE